MKRYFYLVLSLIFVMNTLKSQENLVYNGGFEEYWGPPDIWLMYSLVGWRCVHIDYYNTCCKNIECSVPCNWAGCYYPKSGNAYIGMMLFSVENSGMERIQGILIEPLEKGVKYKVSFGVRLAYQFSDYAAYNIGIYFSKDSIIFKNQNELSFQHKYYKIMEPEHTAHVSNPKGIYIKDTNWVEISGIYTAKGGEQYITIGMFWDDNPKVIKALDEVQNTGDFKKFGKVVAKNTFIRNKYMVKKYKNADSKGEQHFPYYLIDDVSVVKLEE